MYWVLVLGLLLGAVIGQQDLSVRVQQLEAEVRELKQLIRYQQTPTDRRSKRGAARPEWEHCPNGFVRNDNSCYHVSHLLASWPDALVYCAAYGADLLVVESAREQQFIAAHMKTAAMVATDPQRYFWIAGTDAVTEGQWIWAVSAAPVSGFTDWNPGNPNNNPFHPSQHQDCMALANFTGTYRWDDGWCHDEHNFICEIELNSAPVVSLVG